MIFNIYFSGCSCGCTPSESFDIIAQDFETAKVAIARTFFEYRITGKNPYSKIFCKSLTEVERLAVERLADSFGMAKKCISALKYRIRDIENSITKIEMSAQNLQISVPPEAKEKIRDWNIEIGKCLEMLEEEVKKGNDISKLGNVTCANIHTGPIFNTRLNTEDLF